MNAARDSGVVEGERSQARAWATVALLLVCITCSYVDRQVISLLVEPVKADLGLNDTEIGLLQGMAFALCYAIMGLPIARALDRGNRIGITAACISVWTVATAACGFVGNFLQLLLTRALTAVAEAGLPPAALSLICDIFERRLIGRATAFFMLGPYLGTSLALIAGGQMLGNFTASGGLDLPVIGLLTPWRAVFLIVSLPGFILAPLVLLTLREPRRTGGAARAITIPEPLPLLPVFRDHRRLLTPYCIGAVFSVLILFAQTAWLPTFFIRVHHMSPVQVGKMIGVLYLVAGIAGSVTAGLCSTPREGDPLRRVLSLMLAASILLGLSSALVPLMPSATGSLALFTISAFACSMIVALVPAPLQLIVPAAVRAQFITIIAFLLAIGSAGGGPFIVGLLADTLPGPYGGIGPALGLASGGSALIGAIGLAMARRRARS